MEWTRGPYTVRDDRWRVDYAQFGFASPRNPAIWMEIHDERVYQPGVRPRPQTTRSS